MIRDIEKSGPQIREGSKSSPPQSFRLPIWQRSGLLNSFYLDLQSTLETAVEEMMSLLEVDGCAIFEWDRPANRIFATIRCGLDHLWEERVLPSEFTSLSDDPLLARALFERCPQQRTISEPAACSTEVAFFGIAGLQTLLVVPMVVKYRVIGLVTLMDSQTERVFTGKEIGFLQQWANRVASTIEYDRAHQFLREEITRRLQIEKELRWLATRNQAMLDAIPDSMLCFNRQGQMISCKLPEGSGLSTGFSPGCCVGKNLEQVLPADLADITLKSIDQALTSGTVQVFEYQLPTPLGRQDFEIRLVASNPDEVLAVVRNISNRKKAEENLKNHAAKLAEREAALVAEIQSVLAVAQALLSEIDPDNLLEFIVSQVEHLTYADGAAVLLFGEDEQKLEVTSPGESWLRLKPGSCLLARDPLVEFALKNRRVTICNSPQDDERAAAIRSLLEPPKIEALMLAPLMSPKKMLGVLLIWHEHYRAFTAPDSRLVSLFADQAALALHNADLQARNRRLAIQQERDRLARDLHDSVTQSLYAIGLAAQSALRLLAPEAGHAIRNPIEYIHTLSKAALVEMNEQLYDLHPTVFDKDLIEGLTKHCALLNRQYAIDVEFEPRLAASLSKNQSDALFFIAREALWNVVKHARATRATVGLVSKDGQVVVSVQDNGIGFNPNCGEKGERRGLMNMAERVEQLGGIFELHSSPGQGTHLSAQIPL